MQQRVKHEERELGGDRGFRDPATALEDPVVMPDAEHAFAGLGVSPVVGQGRVERDHGLEDVEVLGRRQLSRDRARDRAG